MPVRNISGKMIDADTYGVLLREYASHEAVLRKIRHALGRSLAIDRGDSIDVMIQLHPFRIGLDSFESKYLIDGPIIRLPGMPPVKPSPPPTLPSPPPTWMGEHVEIEAVLPESVVTHLPGRKFSSVMENTPISERIMARVTNGTGPAEGFLKIQLEPKMQALDA